MTHDQIVIATMGIGHEGGGHKSDAFLKGGEVDTISNELLSVKLQSKFVIIQVNITSSSCGTEFGSALVSMLK